MGIKEKIYSFIECHPLIMKIYIKKYNSFKGDRNAVRMSGIRIRNTQIMVKGEQNIVSNGYNCSIQNNLFKIDGHKNKVILKDNVEMIGHGGQNIYIKGNNNLITIEKNCKLTDVSFFIFGNDNKINISENFSGIFVEFHMEQNNNTIQIGKGTTMHGRGHRNIHFALDEGTNIIVGEDCMFSNDIQLRSSDSHSIVDLERRRLNHAKDIKIGNHCWIGLRSLLMKGVELADNTVVAAGSICTRKYDEQHTILAGNPAKVVKRNINWDRKFLE